MKNCLRLCKETGTHGWISRVACGLQAARMLHMCQACQKMKSRANYCTTGQKSQAGQAICSWLKLASQPSHEVKSLKHPILEKLTFYVPSHPTIYIYIYIYPYTHDFERASRENFKRETLEKKRLTHPQSLPKRLFKFLYSLHLHCQILEMLITKTFSHHIQFL